MILYPHPELWTSCFDLPGMQELHSRYYEPLSRVLPSLGALLAGPRVCKLLFMTQPQVLLVFFGG